MAFLLTRNKLLSAACDFAGIIFDELSGTQQESIEDTLNSILAALRQKGALSWRSVWTQSVVTASSEVTGTDSQVYSCILNHTSAASTKPITGTNWETYWRVGGTTGGAWATSTAYTSSAQISPTSGIWSVEDAFFRLDSKDYPVELISQREFAAISDKGVESDPPTKAYFADVSTPYIYLYPQPTEGTLHYFGTVIPALTASNSDPLDFSNHHYRAISLMLAKDISMIYTPSRYITLVAEAESAQRDMLLNLNGSDDDFVEGAY